MSGHADTIRESLESDWAYGGPGTEAFAALDALVAENQRLRDALVFYAYPGSYENATPRTVRPVITDSGAAARAALDGTP